MSSLTTVAVPKSVLDNLKCDRCSRYLSVLPIMHDRQNKLICGRCSEKLDSSALCFRSTAFEAAAQLLLFPCSYANAGCEEQLPWGSVENHELSCDHQFHDCPVSVLESCRWKGNWMMLLEHFKADHKHSVNVKSFIVNLNESICKISLMSLQNHVLLVQLYINKKGKKLSVGVQHLGKPDETDSFSYKLKFRNIDNDGNSNMIMYEDVVISNYNWALGQNNMSQFNISSIKDILKESEVACKIEILVEISVIDQDRKSSTEYRQAGQSKAKNIEGPSCDMEMLTDLECPICLEFMIPPIFVCQNGHSICGECTKKLQNCSSCRAPLRNTRNFLLEKLTSHIKYPCKNISLGCTFVGNSSDIIEHNKKCSLEAAECPLKEPESCNWKGSSANYCEHLLLKHENKIWRACGKTILRDLTLRTIADVHVLDCEDQLFKISCKHSLKASGSVSWTFQQVGLRSNEASPYKFRIKFLPLPNSTMEFQIDSVCLAETSYKDVFNNALTIPYSLLMPFISSSKFLHFRYQVLKV